MEIPAMELEQNGVRLWLTYLPAIRLLDSERVKVDVYSAAAGHTGYQRLPTPARAKDYARYLKDGKGISPNTVLINLRGEVGNFQRISGPYGKLIVPDSTKLWIVDGQHRIEGLRYLLENNPTFAEYPMPVVLMNVSSEYDEAKQFIIINKTQKGVKPDLAERFIAKLMKREGISSLANLPRATTQDIQWRPKATAIVDCLNETCSDTDGDDFKGNPWHKKIQLPNDPRGDTLSSQKAFEDSLKGVLASPFLSAFNAKEISTILVRYWKAILSICKEAATSPRDYVLQRSTGVHVLHSLLPQVVKFATRNMQRPTESGMRTVLSRMSEGMTDEFWRNIGTAGMIGTSHKSQSILIAKLTDALEDGNEVENGEPQARPFEL